MFLIFIAHQKVQKIILFLCFILINHLIAKIIIQEVLFYHVPNSLLFSTLNSIVFLVTTHNKCTDQGDQAFGALLLILTNMWIVREDAIMIKTISVAWSVAECSTKT